MVKHGDIKLFSVADHVVHESERIRVRELGSRNI